MTNGNSGKGGQGGNIILVTNHLENNGTISARGGNGLEGGDGGVIQVSAQHISGAGEFNAAGGNSFLAQLTEEIKKSSHPQKNNMLKDIKKNQNHPVKLKNTLSSILATVGDASSIGSLILSFFK